MDNDIQRYVSYAKGSIVLYGLQDLIVEKNLNNAFKAYIEAARFGQKAPFTTTLEWYDFIKAVTPSD